MTDITWRHPPMPTTGQASRPDPELVAFADALRARPGEWAVYPRPLTNGSARVTGTQIRRGVRQVWEPRGAFEATTRTEGDRVVLYVRFVGEAEAGAA